MSDLFKNIVRLPPPHTARSYDPLTPVYTVNEATKAVDTLQKQLAAANARLKTQQELLVRQSVFMLHTAEKLEAYEEWQATAKVLRRPTREAKQVLNKFVIQQKIEAVKPAFIAGYQYALKPVTSMHSYNQMLEQAERYSEQLRNEQDNELL